MKKNIQKLKINGDVKFKNKSDLNFSTTEIFFDFKEQILFGKERFKVIEIIQKLLLKV